MNEKTETNRKVDTSGYICGSKFGKQWLLPPGRQFSRGLTAHQPVQMAHSSHWRGEGSVPQEGKPFDKGHTASEDQS